MKASGKSRRRTEHLWILGLAAVAIAGSFVLTPVNDRTLCLKLPGVSSPILLPETCMSRLIFGMSCPGCGLTRSFAAMAHGDAWRAFLFNPMGPVLFVLCFLQIPYRVVAYLDLPRFRPLREKMEKRTDIIIWIVSGGLVISWVVRGLLEEQWLRLF